MANKALATRQKMTIRLEPSQKIAKPRNPVAVAAKQRAAGAHGQTASAKRRVANVLVKKMLLEPDCE